MSDNYAASKEIVRILRVIEYVGPREWVDEQIDRRGVKGTFKLPNKPNCQIREAILGETPELWMEAEENVR